MRHGSLKKNFPLLPRHNKLCHLAINYFPCHTFGFPAGWGLLARCCAPLTYSCPLPGASYVIRLYPLRPPLSLPALAVLYQLFIPPGYRVIITHPFAPSAVPFDVTFVHMKLLSIDNVLE